MQLQTGTQTDKHVVNLTARPRQEQHCYFPFDNLRFIDRYIEDKAHILIRLRCVDSEEFFALLHCDVPRIGREDIPENSNGWAVGSTAYLAWRESARDWTKTHRQKQPMLVPNIKLVQLPEDVTPAALVWLQTVEFIHARLPKARYLGCDGLTVECGAIEDWERRVLLGDDPARCRHQTMSDIVERAAKIVNCIPENYGDVRRDVGNFGNAIRYVSGLTIKIGEDRVGIVAPEGFDSCIKLVDVLLGPVVFS